MKKVLNIAICLSIVIAAVVYAADKIPISMAGLTAELKTSVGATVSETNGFVLLSGMGDKDSLTITGVDNVKGIVMDGGKMIKQKGKINGYIDNIIFATEAPSITDPTLIVATLAGNEKLSIKLKGISVGTVLAKQMKLVLVDSLSGAIAGNNAKGVKIMTTTDIAGDVTERLLVGAYDYNVGAGEMNIPVATKIKSIKAKKGVISYVDALNATPAKPGKTKWSAKVAGAGDVEVASLADWSTKNKNVTLVQPVTQ